MNAFEINDDNFDSTVLPSQVPILIFLQPRGAALAER